MTAPPQAPARPPALAARALAKAYGRGARRTAALAGVSLEVPQGAVIGLLGANGAGKSTLLRIALGLARPDAGEVEVLGRAGPPGARTRARIGFLPEDAWLPAHQTTAGALALFGALAGLERREAERRAGALIERLGLDEVRDRPLEGLSKGTRRRVGVAQAALAAPDLLVLDEPTDGVDPVGRARVRDLIRDERARGAAVLLSSHVLSEVERIADRVTVLAGGRVALEGPVEALTRAAGDRWALSVARPSPAFERALVAAVGASAIAAPGGEAGRAARAADARGAPAGAFVLGPVDGAALDRVIAAVVACDAGLRELRPLEVALEEVVVEALARGGER